MEPIKLSEHFSFDEFTDRDHHIFTPVQMQMVSHLCTDILEPLRSFACKQLGESTFRIVSGMRFPSDNNSLRRQGFNPSEKSDHLFGNVIKLHDQKNIDRYGKYYQYSVGAVDFIPSCGALELWKEISKHFKPEGKIIGLPGCSIEIGQCILEKRNGYWIHVSNPKGLIYSRTVADTFLKSEPFLISTDNGVTYKPFTKG